MTGSGPDVAEDLDSQTIRLTVKDGRYLVWSDRFSTYGEGNSADAALLDMSNRVRARKDFSKRCGHDAIALLNPVEVAGARGARGWRKTAAILVVSGLVAMQFGYALSIGISRGVGSAFDLKWRTGLYAGFERSLERFADPKNDLSPERRDKLIQAIRGIKARYRPIWNEAFGTDEENRTSPSPSPR